MFHKEILKKMRGETSGGRALEYIYRFWAHDRLSTFPGYHRAAETTKGIMEEIGLSNVEILKYKTTGTNFFADWEGPQGWDAISGVLDVKGPKDETRRIADRQADPCNLMLWCGSTPPEGVNTKIVRADTEDAIKGKLLFQDKVPLDYKLREKIIEKGALGIISDELPYWPDVRVREENMYLVRWHNAFLFPQNRENILAFSITPANGDWLRGLLAEQGEVEAFARVKTKLYDSYLPVTTGVIPGTVEPGKEIWLIQHLHEVGAHDNASGVGASLEVVRSIIDMVSRGKLEAPKRTIRVICSWEVIGFLAHLTANPEITERVICALNPDMVGAKQEICNSWLQVFLEPHSNPHFIDDLTLDLVGELYKNHPRWHWEKQKFIINDNFLADPMIGIPCPSIIFMRDRHYHTSSDRPENLDTTVMGEISALLATGAYTVANGGAKSAEELVDVVFRNTLSELAGLIADHRDSVSFDERLQHLKPVLHGRLETLTDLVLKDEKSKKLTEKIRKAKERLEAIAESARPEGPGFKLEPKSDLEREADSIVPVRKVWGSYSLGRVPKKVKKERDLASFSSWSYDDNAPIFWSDGKRSIFQIQWLVGQEQGKTPKLEKLMTLFRTLEEYDYFSLKKR